MVAGAQHKLVGARDFADRQLCEDLYPGGTTFLLEHGDDLLRRSVAEKLAQGLLVIGNAVPLDQGYEISRGVPRQRRFRKVRVGRKEMLGLAVQVGKVAAPASGNENLFA